MTVPVYIRGQADPFGMFDESPAWQQYTTAVSQPWRYVQVRLGAAGWQASKSSDAIGRNVYQQTDNWWNVDISSAPLSTDPASATFMANWYDRGDNADGWFRLWGNDTGIPLVTISGGADQINSGDVQWIEWSSQSYGNEGDWSGNASAWYKGKFPIPTAALTEDGWHEEYGKLLTEVPVGDRHLIVFNTENGYIYEAYNPQCIGGVWSCASTAVWDTRTNNRRTQGWTSTDAAGLSVGAGLVRYDEFISGDPITHAHRCTALYGRQTEPGSRWPASHYATQSHGDGWPPLGTRLRLKASTDISAWSAPLQRLLTSFKNYGLIVTDYGIGTGNFEVTGTMDPRWGTWDTGYCGEARLCGFAMLKSDWEMIEWGWGAPEGWTDMTI